MRHFAAKSIDFRGALCQTTNQNPKPDVLGLLTESGISLYSLPDACSDPDDGLFGLSGSLNCN